MKVTTARTASFGPYALDLRSGELRKFGTKVKMGEQPFQILLILLERSGEMVTREELREKLWADDTFVDFDHGLNSAVQRLRDCLSDSAGKPRWIDTLPRRGYRFIGQVEWSENGVLPEVLPQSDERREEQNLNDAERSSPAQELSETRGTLRGNRGRSALLVALVLVLMLAATLIAKRVQSARSVKQSRLIRSLAVLPLENLSGDPTQEYFADGMTDELITMLAKNTSMQIISRTSVMQYKKAHRPLPEIARELGVDGILEGSVGRSGNRVHINAQLIHGPSDTHIWAESYDRDLSDVGSLQSDLARTIARQVGLMASLPAVQPPRRINPAAHDAYLLGRYYWFEGQSEKGKECYEKAIAIDPDYAEAWSGLADYYIGKGANGDAPPEKLIPQGEAAARKAVELDDSSAEAHNSLAAAYYFGRWDWAAADRESARAVELDPHNIGHVHHIRAYVLSTLNRTEEAISEEKKSMEIDPFSSPWAVGMQLIRARQFDAAISELFARRQAQPGNASVREVLSLAFWFAGRDQEAATEREEMYRLGGDKEDADAVRTAFQRGGFRAVLEFEMSSLKNAAALGYVSPFYLSNLAARLHRKNEALHYLELAYQEHSTKMVRVPDDPVYDFLRPEPRFQAILRKMGLPSSR